MSTLDTSVPLVWTTKGNLPGSQLVIKQSWIDNDDETTLALEYFDGDELVRRDVHMRLKKSVISTAEAAGF